MEYVHLGRSGLKVSRLCLGTMNFGPDTREEAAFTIMDAALDHGINFFDTANVYGRTPGEGVTERILGRWLTKSRQREKVVLATKVYGEMAKWPNHARLSALHIRRSCDDSLRRLQTDHIDLLQMHHIDRETPWEEIWQAMEVLVQQGKIIYVGSSNFAGWHIARANEMAHSRNFVGLISEQSRYNLLTRHVELEVLPACRQYGVGLIPWSPLASGALAGSARRDGANQSRRTSDWSTAARQRHAHQLTEYGALCAKLGQDPADVALAWLLHQPGVTAPIIGPRTLEQLTTSLGALELELTGTTLAELDRLFPGYRSAPEEYAW